MTRLTPEDLRRARVYASRPERIEGRGAAEWITALVDHAEIMFQRERLAQDRPATVQNDASAVLAEIRRVLAGADPGARPPGSPCLTCGHLAWAHGDQDLMPPDGAPCHAMTGGLTHGECFCPGGYQS